MGTFPAFLAAWGPVDMGFGSGQGVKCYHSEHLYGELWHRAFIVAADTPSCNYLISCGNNIEASGGVVGIWRHADARVRGMKRVQVEPHLSVTGACSAQWVPIKPKTDPAFLYALIHVMLHEAPRTQLDLPHLAQRTSSPYLVGATATTCATAPRASRWSGTRPPAAPCRTTPRHPRGAVGPGAGRRGGDRRRRRAAGRRPAGRRDRLRQAGGAHGAVFARVGGRHLRRARGHHAQIAQRLPAHACVGQTVTIGGKTLPFRPVAVTLGKTVNNGWGGYECCWARTLLATLVGALEVPGGTIGTTVRLVKPMAERHDSVRAGEDGLMDYPFNPTDKAAWSARPNIRNAYKTMVPLTGNNAWAQALGPTHFSWMFLDETPKGLPKVEPPDVWFVYRTNPAISFWDTPGVASQDRALPVHRRLCLHARREQPLCRRAAARRHRPGRPAAAAPGGHQVPGTVLGTRGLRAAPAGGGAAGQARDFTDICTELARRCGLLEKYNAAINRGTCGVKLDGPFGDFSLDPLTPHSREAIWDAACKAASAELSEGAEVLGLDWWKEHGLKTRPFPREQWYLYPTVVERGLRFEMPYQERLKRIGVQLGRRLHENDMHWWDKQLEEYQALPPWKDFPGLWEASVAKAGGQPADYPFWLVTARSMQYAWGGNVGVQMIREVAGNVAGHNGVVMNPRAASAGHGRRRPGRHRHATPQHARPGRAAPGHPPRHPAAGGPVRPLGHAAGQGLRHAQPEHAGRDVAGPDRCHRLGRRPGACEQAEVA
jgi:phenylacetyl-CoA:acceptor oxidoreductase